MRDDHLSMSSMRLFPGIRFMHFHSQVKYVSPRDNVFCSPIIQTQLSRQICFVLVNDFKMFMFVCTTLYKWYYNLVLLLDSLINSYNYFCFEGIKFLHQFNYVLPFRVIQNNNNLLFPIWIVAYNNRICLCHLHFLVMHHFNNRTEHEVFTLSNI